MLRFARTGVADIDAHLPSVARAEAAFWIFVALFPLIVFLKGRAQERRSTPDAHIYIALASGARGPAPYCYRVLLPLLAGAASTLSRNTPRDMLALLGRLGTLGAVGATYVLTWTVSGSHARALLSAYAVALADSFFAVSWRTPWLVDGAAATLALTAATLALNGETIPAAIVLCAAVLVKEAWAALGWAFIVGAMPGLWWTCLPALATHAVVRLSVTAADPDPARAPWLVHPIGWVAAHKRRTWFEWRTNVARLGPTPWLLAYYAGRSPLMLSVIAVVVLSWAQTHVATDHDRLLAHMLPFVVPIVCSTAPMEVLIVYVLASAYWPFYRDA